MNWWWQFHTLPCYNSPDICAIRFNPARARYPPAQFRNKRNVSWGKYGWLKKIPHFDSIFVQVEMVARYFILKTISALGLNIKVWSQFWGPFSPLPPLNANDDIVTACVHSKYPYLVTMTSFCVQGGGGKKGPKIARALHGRLQSFGQNKYFPSYNLYRMIFSRPSLAEIRESKWRFWFWFNFGVKCKWLSIHDRIGHVAGPYKMRP